MCSAPFRSTPLSSPPGQYLSLFIPSAEVTGRRPWRCLVARRLPTPTTISAFTPLAWPGRAAASPLPSPTTNFSLVCRRCRPLRHGSAVCAVRRGRTEAGLGAPFVSAMQSAAGIIILDAWKFIPLCMKEKIEQNGKKCLSFVLDRTQAQAKKKMSNYTLNFFTLFYYANYAVL